MKKLTAPRESARYPNFAFSSVMDVRMKLGMSRISLSHRELLGYTIPLLIIDFFNEKGKLYTLRYNLPPESPERTERRISLFLHLLRQALAKTTTTAEVA